VVEGVEQLTVVVVAVVALTLLVYNVAAVAEQTLLVSNP
jgi:hypothetical protein